MHAPAFSAFVETEVEFSAIEERKDIMKKRVQVGEIDYAAGRNDQKMWVKLLVLLNKLKVGARS